MIAFPTNHALMPHVDSNGLLVSRALVVHPPRRRNRQIPSLHPCIGAFSPILSETQPEFLHFALTWPGFDSRARDSFATSPTEPSVEHICRITSPEIHLTPQSHYSYQLEPPVRKGISMSAPLAHQPYQHPASMPRIHCCVVQYCRARLHVVTLCAFC